MSHKINEGELTMNTTGAFDMAKRMSEDMLNYGPDRSRLLIRVMRLLAHGEPVEGERVDQIIANLGITHDDANQFLRQITERDERDRIVGIMGLSLNDHPHRFMVNACR
jgi:vacuolar-type H+-ATPase subunit B/Vma2